MIIKPRRRHEGEQKTAHFTVSTSPQGEHYGLNKVWGDYLEPNLSTIAQPLLSGIARKLEEMHYTLSAWNSSQHNWWGPTWNRSDRAARAR
ncbi:MAG: hypothetical protein M3Q16_06970 [Pseudomonadota bacterium]|nr:hypothetical protein [Pseudomonadota bacterium]